MHQRWLTVAIVALVLVVHGGGAGAQLSIPNGVFVQDGMGHLWLVLDGKKVSIPIWIADYEEVRQLPKSDRWAVANETGAIVAGDPPSWLSGDGLVGPFESPLQGRSLVLGVAGQEATGTFMGQQIRATVQEMSILDALPAVGDAGVAIPQARARGKFVVVAVRLENIGKRAVCCPPEYTLRDARERYFTGDTDKRDPLVTHARASVYVRVPEIRGDLQPNMPVAHVLVYDVPSDATGFVLSPPQ